MYKLKIKGVITMQKSIDKINKETQSQDIIKKYGMAAGLTWAKTAHHNELVFVEDWSKETFEIIQNEIQFGNWYLVDAAAELRMHNSIEGEELYEYFDEQLNEIFEDGWENEDAYRFLEAWIEAVMDFYNKI